MQNTTNFWLIRAITNLHVGSGDADYGIIDKQVQRDSVTGLPVINASSIKGAFREACEDHNTKDIQNTIFGTENSTDRKNETNLIQGSCRFFSAKLLALPVRSSHDFYYVATCIELLEDLVNDAKVFEFGLPEDLIKNIEQLKKNKPKPGNPHCYGGSNNSPRLEDWNASKQNGDSGLEALFGDRVALLHANDLKVLSDELPIIARNHLENGISTNLWYEQVVPRESRFYCPMVGNVNLLEQTLKNNLKNLLQIGGNATVGYGLTKFIKL